VRHGLFDAAGVWGPYAPESPADACAWPLDFIVRRQRGRTI